MNRWVRRLVGLAAVGHLHAGIAGPASGEACDFPTSIGVDMVRADTTTFVLWCRGYGQVFLATDTLIRSISIWRPPTPAGDAWPRQLFITETFVEYEGLPDTQQLLLDAGPLVRRMGDGVSPVEYRWVFDPPFALPHRGKFFFVVQANLPPHFPAATTNPYPDGQAWETGPAWECSRPGGARSYSSPVIDLIFEVQFCGGATISTLPKSWGRLEVIHR